MFNLTTAVEIDTYLAKYAPDRTLLWARSWHPVENTRHVLLNCSLDSDGNVNLFGDIGGTVTFGAGEANETTLTAPTGNVLRNVFLGKLDGATGELLSIRDLGTRNTDLFAREVDTQGNLYLAGNFSGTADFDLGAGVANLTSAGGLDSVVSKYDSQGNFLSAQRFGGAADDLIQGLVPHDDGSLYLTGQFSSSFDFDPGPGVINLTPAGGNSVYVGKLDASGAGVWAKRIGGSGARPVIDASGNLILAGTFTGKDVDFDPGPGTSLMSSVSITTQTGGTKKKPIFTTTYTQDAYLLKLDANGSFVWARALGGPGIESTTTLDTDAAGNVYVGGHFDNAIDLDPGAGVFNVIHAGQPGWYTDIYLSKLNSSGQFQWGFRLGNDKADVLHGVAVDNSNNVYVAGTFNSQSWSVSTVDFDPGAGVHNITSSTTLNSGFLLKLTQPAAASAAAARASDPILDLALAVSTPSRSSRDALFAVETDWLEEPSLL